MAIAAHDVSMNVLRRGLQNLKVLLAKGEAHAADPAALLGARLADDMYDLAAQVKWAAEAAKLTVGRLVGDPVPPSPGEDRSFAALYVRIDEALACLEAVPAESLEAGLERTIEITWRGETVTFTGTEFLLQFAIPNFYFHFTTAYAILRAQGVQVTKREFTGLSFG
jgi:hypothetical protein